MRYATAFTSIVIGMTRQSDQTRNSIRRVLEDHLAEVVSSDVATRIVQQARAASNGASEAAQARTASRAPGSGVARIQSAARGQSSRGRMAAILVEIATQGMASTIRLTAARPSRLWWRGRTPLLLITSSQPTSVRD